MTKKDFQLIADVVKKARNTSMITLDEAAILGHMFSDALARTNERFDKARFINACIEEDK